MPGKRSSKISFICIVALSVLVIAPFSLTYEFIQSSSVSEIPSGIKISRPDKNFSLQVFEAEGVVQHQDNLVDEHLQSKVDVVISQDEYTLLTPAKTYSISTVTGSLTSLAFNTTHVTTQKVKIDLSHYQFQNYGFTWDEETEFTFSSTGENSTSVQFITPHGHQGGPIGDDTNTFGSDLYTVDPDSKIILLENIPRNTFTIDLLDATTQQEQISTAASANHNNGMTYTTLPIFSRYEWSGDKNINDPARFTWDPIYYPSKRFVIHHTATDENQNSTQAVRNIYTYHRFSRGWGDIAYSYLIAKDGRIFEGKAGGEDSINYGSSQVWGNRESIAISFIGNFSDHLPSAAALDSAKKLIAEKSVLHSIDLTWGTNNVGPNEYPNVPRTFYGHRNFDNTACPGQAFYNYLPTLMQSASNYKANHFSGLKNVVQQANQQFESNSFADPSTLSVFVNEGYNGNVENLIPLFSGINSYTTGPEHFILTLVENPEPDWVNENTLSYDISDRRMLMLYILYELSVSEVDYQVMGNGYVYQPN